VFAVQDFSTRSCCAPSGPNGRFLIAMAQGWRGQRRFGFKATRSILAEIRQKRLETYGFVISGPLQLNRRSNVLAPYRIPSRNGSAPPGAWAIQDPADLGFSRRILIVGGCGTFASCARSPPIDCPGPASPIFVRHQVWATALVDPIFGNDYSHGSRIFMMSSSGSAFQSGPPFYV
jgi:hypothetical protein